jgi:hypothetical protein
MSKSDQHNQPTRPALLSDAYRELNAELHRRDPNYGTTGRQHVETIRTLAKKYKARHILDYGCGKRDLWHALHDEFDVRNFDPTIQGLDAPPEPADFVACIDVLEHVEPDFLESVLADLARLTLDVSYITIATQPSLKHLADGTNCHRIVEAPTWWIRHLERHFCVTKILSQDTSRGLQLIVDRLRIEESSKHRNGREPSQR